MPRFRQKPIVIEAIQFDGDNISEIDAFVDDDLPYAFRHVAIHLPGGMAEAGPGDWIVKGVNGEFSVCQDGIFPKMYEPAEAGDER